MITRALIADESRLVRRVLTLLMQDYAPELEPVSADTGADAVALAAATEPVIIFLSGQFQDMSAVDVVTRLRAHGRTCPIVMMIANQEAERMKELCGAGVDCFVGKPFSTIELQDALQLVTGRAPVLRFLLIDDSNVQRMVIKQTVTALGMEMHIHEASDGASGLRQFFSRAYDVVFLDINLPRLNGVEVLREMRAARPNVRVLVLTADPDGADAKACLKEGAHAVLAKPIAPAHLIETVFAALSEQDVTDKYRATADH